MEHYDFTYEFPVDFHNRVIQILRQTSGGEKLVTAFQNSKFEYENVGLAYYAGLKGDNWNKYALDFAFEGSKSDMEYMRYAQGVLKDVMAKGLRSNVTGFVVRDVIFLEKDSIFFPSSDKERLNADLADANNVLKDLIKISERLSTNAIYRSDTPENNINDFIRDGLLLLGYSEVKDQTRHGFSLTGIDAGEVDILISKDGKERAIFEGLKLRSVDSKYIDKHILKAIVNYNALGTATFIVAYVSSADFESFWQRYTELVKGYKYPLQIKRPLQIMGSPNAAVRIAQLILSRDGYDFPVYFMLINIH